MTTYELIDAALRPVLQSAMPRAPRIYAPGATAHVVARCNNRVFYFAEDERVSGILGYGYVMPAGHTGWACMDRMWVEK